MVSGGMSTSRPPASASGLRLYAQRVWQFFTHGLWHLELGSMDRMRRFLVRTLRVGVLVVRGFREDHCPLQASRLSYLTLISLVPVLAVGFGVLSGFGMGDQYLTQFEEATRELPEQPRMYVEQVVAVVRATNLAGMTSVGVVAFLILVVRMLVAVESAFNRIWGVREARGLRTRLTSYVSVLVLVPILLAAAGTIYNRLRAGDPEVWLTGLPVTGFLLGLAPWVAVWLAFGVVYVLVPNTRVDIRAGIAGGLVGAAGWMVWQRLYVPLQLGVVRLDNPVYASFMTVPIFLIWVYNSWLIVLLGAEMSFALQNVSTYELEHGAKTASPRARLALSVDLLEAAARAHGGEGPVLHLPAFAAARRVPIRLLNDLTGTLAQLGLLIQAADPPDTWVLQRSPESIRIADLVASLLSEGDDQSLRGLREPGEAGRRVLARIREGMRQRIEGLTLADLLESAEPPA